MKEFNLSEKIEWKTRTIEEISINDVKEFIRLLKEELNEINSTPYTITVIDKLVGEELLK